VKKKDTQPILWIFLMMAMMGAIVYWVIGPSKVLTSFMEPNQSSSNHSKNFFAQFLSFFGWHLQGGPWSQNNNDFDQNNPSSQQMGNSNKGYQQGRNSMTGAMTSEEGQRAGQNGNNAGYGDQNSPGYASGPNANQEQGNIDTLANNGQGPRDLSDTNAENNPENNAETTTGDESNPENNAETTASDDNNPENNAEIISLNNPSSGQISNFSSRPNDAQAQKNTAAANDQPRNTSGDIIPINPVRTNADILQSIAQQNENRNTLNSSLSNNAMLSEQIRQQVEATKFQPVDPHNIPAPVMPSKSANTSTKQ